MLRSRARRTHALVLLAALLGGGFGLPLFDVFVFHTQPGAAARVPVTLGVPGGPLAHTQLCLLAFDTAQQKSVPAGSTPIPRAAAAQRDTPLAPAVTSPSRPEPTLGLSRAPPRA